MAAARTNTTAARVRTRNPAVSLIESAPARARATGTAWAASSVLHQRPTDRTARAAYAARARSTYALPAISYAVGTATTVNAAMQAHGGSTCSSRAQP